MAKDRKFKVGDVALLVDNGEVRFKVKILDVVEDDGETYYTVTPTDWVPIGVVNREVPESKLFPVN